MKQAINCTFLAPLKFWQINSFVKSEPKYRMISTLTQVRERSQRASPEHTSGFVTKCFNVILEKNSASNEAVITQLKQ